MSKKPLIICDSGHNEAGIKEIVKQIEEVSYNKLHIVFGVVNDKTLDTILNLLPKKAIYYFTKADIPRALDETILQKEAEKYGLKGESFPTVNHAFEIAKQNAENDDLIFVGGSIFVVAEVL